MRATSKSDRFTHITRPEMDGLMFCRVVLASGFVYWWETTRPKADYTPELIADSIAIVREIAAASAQTSLF